MRGRPAFRRVASKGVYAGGGSIAEGDWWRKRGGTWPRGASAAQIGAAMADGLPYRPTVGAQGGRVATMPDNPHPLNQSAAVGRKLNPLIRLLLKSSRSFNSIKSVVLMNEPREESPK